MGKKRKESDSEVEEEATKKKKKEADRDADNGETKKNKKHSKFPPELPTIKDAKLNQTVFTHQGTLGNAQDVGLSYERLEILGDAIIERIATFLIFHRFPKLRAGTLSQVREKLVKNETLAEYTTMYGLDVHIKTHSLHEDPKRWIKVKGDVFEAYVAAVVLSNGGQGEGEKIVEEWLAQLWEPKLGDVQQEETPVQAKEMLAKKIMGKGIKIRYNEERPMVQHAGGIRTYYIGAYLTGWGWQNQHLGSGHGASKVIAGNEAARTALANPLTAKISQVKREYDEKVAAKRSLEANAVPVVKLT